MTQRNVKLLFRVTHQKYFANNILKWIFLNEWKIVYFDSNLYLFPVVQLTHWGRVTHMYVDNLGHHWLRWWLVAWSAPSHYRNQGRNIANWTHRNKLQLNFNPNSYIFIQEDAFENVDRKIAAISSPPQCVNNYSILVHIMAWRRPNNKTLSDHECTARSR